MQKYKQDKPDHQESQLFGSSTWIFFSFFMSGDLLKETSVEKLEAIKSFHFCF